MDRVKTKTMKQLHEMLEQLKQKETTPLET